MIGQTHNLKNRLGLGFARLFALVGVLVFLAGGAFVFAQDAGVVLTNAADILSLSANQASRYVKVSVTGTVTASDPMLKGRFFVQDSTAGVFVDNVNGRRPEPGELVQVSGITHPGAYAPIITAPSIRSLGTALLPAAKVVSIDRLMSGAEDSQRIEISALVRTARIDGPRLVADLASGGFRFRVYAPAAPGLDPLTLVATQVRVRGTAAEAHNRSLRQLVAVEVYVPTLEDFVVEKPEAVNPFNRPPAPLNSLAQYGRDNSFNQRVHVHGVVTLQRPGDNLFLEDLTGGLQVKSPQAIALARGDIVEAIGFLGFEDYLPVLQDAVLRKVPQPRMVITPKPALIGELQSGLHHADFISCNGKLLDRTVRQVGVASNTPASTRTTLVLQSDNLIFTAEADEPSSRAKLATIPIGSTLEASGICLTEIDIDGKVKAIRILIGSPNDVVVLGEPSWFTPKRLLIGFAAVCCILVVIIGWTVMVSRRNSVLNFLIRERERAQVELQQAHDLLEQRVKERTAELKFQITARKESEVRFKAVLAERTRLAQELHDTVEQTLTGIALQLDTASKLFEQKPIETFRHLELARNLMATSQVEVRRSIWDLRSRALEQFDLPGALLGGARQITAGGKVQVRLETKGQVQTLPEVVEENLLRIGQEAVTNVIKHSRATEVAIQLVFEPLRVILEIKDNGDGFNPEHSAGARDGHFGLLGMSERAKRLGGRLTITSAPGQGTTIRVEIPLDPSRKVPSPAPPDAPEPDYVDENAREDSHPDSR
jgi:signal transduction histidine kinase